MSYTINIISRIPSLLSINAHNQLSITIAITITIILKYRKQFNSSKKRKKHLKIVIHEIRLSKRQKEI